MWGPTTIHTESKHFFAISSSQSKNNISPTSNLHIAQHGMILESAFNT